MNRPAAAIVMLATVLAMAPFVDAQTRVLASAAPGIFVYALNAESEAPVCTWFRTLAGATYVGVVSGTYTYSHTAGDWADAQFRTHSTWLNDIVRWPNFLVNGQTPNYVDPNWNAAHTYAFWFTGNNDFVCFQIHDDPGTYYDNTGALTVVFPA